MRWLVAVLFAVWSWSASAQLVLSHREALLEDAEQYAAAFKVTPDEAVRRLEAQERSVPVTDSIAREFADRIAGISISNSADYRIIVLLTGNDPVPSRTAAGFPVVFRTGAKATHAQAQLALRRHLIDLRSDLPNARGAGYDQKTGQIVLLVTSADASRLGLENIRNRAEEVSGVPVRVVVNELDETDMGAKGGGRVEGINLATNRRNLCTSAFVVTNGEARAIATAAHCPDQLTYVERDGSTIDLPMIGSWGRGYQDVQLNGTADAPDALFYSNRGAGTLRRLASWRNSASTRGGDFVCHYGESSGYSCASVELTDYAPPGDLCGGPCTPTWITVRGPNCVPGDSGGPVFVGDTAFGIAKGVNREDGRCLFYYYMSTDYLPSGWRLLIDSDVTPQGSLSVVPTLVQAPQRRSRSLQSGSTGRHARSSAADSVPRHR